MDWIASHPAAIAFIANSALYLVLAIVTDRAFASMDRRVTRMERRDDA